MVIERRQFHLKFAFSGTGPVAEDLQNQGGAVNDFTTPRFLEVALLDRAERCIDDGKADFIFGDQRGDFLDLAFAEIGGWRDTLQAHNGGMHDVECDRASEPDRLFKPGMQGTVAALMHRNDGMKHQGANHARLPSWPESFRLQLRHDRPHLRLCRG